MSMKPFFSIVIPCCDIAPYARACLDSLKNQSFTDWECLAVVETSKDDTEQIVREAAAGDPRFQVFTQPRSGSAAMPRNTGLAHAQGDYILFIDGDDLLEDDALRRLQAHIAARPHADVYCFGCHVLNENTDAAATVSFPDEIDNFPRDAPPELTGCEATLLNGRTRAYLFPPPWMNAFRRQYLLERNLRFSPGFALDDGEFAPRALVLARRVVPIHESLYRYRIRPSSQVTAGIVWLDRLNDLAIRYRRLLAFHAEAARTGALDARVTRLWSRNWLRDIVGIWFLPHHIRNVPRAKRVESLGLLFADGFEDFNLLRKAAAPHRRLTGWWVAAFARHPSLRGAAEAFFRLYFAATHVKTQPTRA